jgi:hypothetical protein
MREINGSITESIRNRNLSSERIFASDEVAALPIKYDLLNGQPIRDWNFMESMWNAMSPVNLKMEDSPGRNLLWNSNYDLRLVSYSSPDNIDLSDHPHVRSWFQQELGKLNLEKTLNELAADPKIQNSVQRMNDDLRNGKRELDPMKAYVHNQIINDRFERARKKAWAKVRENHPAEIDLLYEERRQQRVDVYKTLRETQGRFVPGA